jgi:hypothetical protein
MKSILLLSQFHLLETELRKLLRLLMITSTGLNYSRIIATEFLTFNTVLIKSFETTQPMTRSNKL